MHWTGRSIVLTARPFAERSAVVGVFSAEQGLYYGAVRLSSSKGARALWQPGNLVEARWQARLAEHLGNLSGELIDPVSFHVMQDAARLLAVTSLASLIERVLPEREAHAVFYDTCETLLMALKEAAEWLPAYVRFELSALQCAGFGLDLSVCAATGGQEGLVYVSPKSGRAVSREAGAPYAEKLLSLPCFLRENQPQTGINPREILDGLRLTGYFLEKWLLDPQGRQLPARERFVARVEQELRAVA